MQMQKLTCRSSNSHADAGTSHADAGTHIQVQELTFRYRYVRRRCRNSHSGAGMSPDANTSVADTPKQQHLSSKKIHK
jgi:hypothetical protein